tara:strand:+ start:89 stop:415 length:327 start_codon:yes stop_codon:yes gene_type:complete
LIELLTSSIILFLKFDFLLLPKLEAFKPLNESFYVFFNASYDYKLLLCSLDCDLNPGIFYSNTNDLLTAEVFYLILVLFYYLLLLCMIAVYVSLLPPAELLEDCVSKN